jgi:hypothetical protein
MPHVVRGTRRPVACVRSASARTRTATVPPRSLRDALVSLWCSHACVTYLYDLALRGRGGRYCNACAHKLFSRAELRNDVPRCERCGEQHGARHPAELRRYLVPGRMLPRPKEAGHVAFY